VSNDKLCPTRLATHIRAISWAPVTNVDPIEGVTIPHPAHQFQIDYLSEDMKKVQHNGSPIGVSDQTRGEYMVFKLTDSATTELHTTLGPYAHYIGSTTQEKKSGTIYQIPYAGRLAQAAERLIQLSSWLVDPTSPLKAYLEAATSRTDIPLTLLNTATKTIT
jgi:hypothetical protein